VQFKKPCAGGGGLRPLNKKLSSIRAWLKPSAQIDLGLILTGLRVAMRTNLTVPVEPKRLRQIAFRFGLFVCSDRDGFLVLSRHPATARRLLNLDRSPGPHAREVGRLLGYPPCCTRAAARVGESALDHWAREAAEWRYVGRFAAINPRLYTRGEALMSHIPCSKSCRLSLQIAEGFGAAMSASARMRGGNFELLTRKWNGGWKSTSSFRA
jgi:hypothetical protein